MGGVKAVLLLGLCAVGTVRALTQAEVQEIRHFASKAYGTGKGPLMMDSMGSFSHYVGRRMKPLTVQQPYTVFMKPVARPYLEPQISGSVNNYNFAPFGRNFLSPPPSYNRFQAPPPPSKFRFGGGPSFSYSFPPVPQAGYAKRPPHQIFHSYPGIPVVGPNGQQVQQFQLQHGQKLQAVMSQQHQLNVQQAQSQVQQSQADLKVKGNEIKINEVKKVPEEVKPVVVNTKSQGNIKSNEFTKFTQAFSFAPQTHETVPAEVITRHIMTPPNFMMTQYGPAVPAVMQHNTRFPLRYERLTPMTFHYRPQPQPVHMTTVYQSEAFPEYSFHTGPNHNFVRYQSFIAPSFVPLSTPAPQPTQQPKQSEQASEVKPTGQETESPTPIPSTDGETVVFESARIPEDVVARRPGGSSNSRPQPLTPQEQRNVYTSAADSSMVVAPLVYSENSASPVKKGKGSSEEEVAEVTSTTRSVSTVTKVLPGGKRVRLRKVKKESAKDKASA